MRHYRGWKSTKLHLALITMGIITGVYALAGFPVAAFGEFTMAITAAAGIYSSTAAAEKFVRPEPPPPSPPGV
jgi:hypothetical protein